MSGRRGDILKGGHRHRFNRVATLRVRRWRASDKQLNTISVPPPTSPMAGMPHAVIGHISFQWDSSPNIVSGRSLALHALDQ